MKRLFIAVDLPKQVKDLAADAKAILEHEIRGARWVAPENVHLTLKFLGNCRDEQLEVIETGLRAGLSDCRAINSGTTVFGAFPAPKKARVLWLGMEEGPDIEGLAAHARTAMAAIGFKADERRFRPHITLARFRRPGPVDIDMLGSKIDSRNFVRIDAVTLFSSVLTRKGPIYEAMAKIDLKV